MSDEWQERAACRDTDPDVFFPDDMSRGAAAAKRICAGCSVVQECLDDELGRGVTAGRYGIRGGLTPNERIRLRKYRRLKNSTAACGTDSGYYRHRDRQEDACDACKEAHARKQQDWNRRRRMSTT